MAPRKGITNNPAGRPAGRPNKITTEIKTRIRLFLDQHWDQFEADFMKLDARDRTALIKDLLKYAAPTMRESDVKFNFDELSEDDLNTIIDKMLDTYGK
jgi:hypothetical protein